MARIQPGTLHLAGGPLCTPVANGLVLDTQAMVEVSWAKKA